MPSRARRCKGAHPVDRERTSKIDDYTVEITTKEHRCALPLPAALVPDRQPGSQWEKLGKDWAKVALQPSGTGPFKLDKLVPRERAELVKNAAYWDKTRIAKTDRIVLILIPDAVTRTNALLERPGRPDRDAAARHAAAARWRRSSASCRT